MSGNALPVISCELHILRNPHTLEQPGVFAVLDEPIDVLLKRPPHGDGMPALREASAAAARDQVEAIESGVPQALMAHFLGRGGGTDRGAVPSRPSTDA